MTETPKPEPTSHVKLSQWPATAICGNDITSSCLYVSALALLWAGPWGPISLLLVAGVLWLFRSIYGEVVGALPLNGGAYNALLNTTSKKIASIAACLTILSYLATAVISAHEAVHYGIEASEAIGLREVLHHNAFLLTVLLLFVFTVLTIKGIGESAQVALGIFIFHMVSLLTLSLVGALYVYNEGTALFFENWNTAPPFPSEHPLLFGFCVAMLGISGFESSANFVEEQQNGVFPKTLRNMWIAVSVFNPLMAFLALAIIPLGKVINNKEALLAKLAEVAGGETFGQILATIISVDASLVLSGAVLTSFVGVTGLIHRMTLDRCLPQFLLKQSRYQTYHRVIFAFFLLSTLLLYLAGNVSSLAGVYTISFLSVMFLFCVGNGMLKVYRGRLPRDTKASWATILIASLAVLIALVGNIYLKFTYFVIFVYYFVPTVLLIFIMLYRTALLKAAIYMVRGGAGRVLRVSRKLTHTMQDLLSTINSQTIVFFTRGDNIANLNEAMLYVRANEHTDRVKIVTVLGSGEEPPERLKKDLEFLDEVYPEIVIEFVAIQDEFTPALLHRLSKEWNIPLNFMFIGSPGDHFPHRLAELGGVRLII